MNEALKALEELYKATTLLNLPLIKHQELSRLASVIQKELEKKEKTE